MPSKRQGQRKAKRGAAEDAEKEEIGRGKTGFQTEDLTMSTLLKNQWLTLFLSPCSLRRSAAPGLFPLALAWRELEIEVPVGGVVISEVVELDEKIQVAPSWIEPPVGRRPEHVQPPHAVLPAERGKLVAVLFEEGDYHEEIDI